MEDEEDMILGASAVGTVGAVVADVEVDEEDEVQDWSNLTKTQNSKADHALPKRGEKDYEPDGTEVQNDQLKKSRDAMFDALEGPRGHVVKQNVRAIWMDSLNKGLIRKPKGSFLQTVGIVDKEQNCWLNAEEFVYLSERGTIEPWFEKKDLAMDLQSVYAQCFNNEDEIDEYQVYSHLKRHGYIVSRCKNDVIEKFNREKPSLISQLISNFLNSKIITLISSCLRKFNLVSYTPFHDLHFITSRYFNYSQIFNSLKLIPARISKNDSEISLSITFNVWKPNPQFSKKNPPLPNFQMIVRNVNKYNLPTLTEINSVFDRTEIITKTENNSKLSQMNKLKNGKESVILALIDYGVISFVKFSRGSFNEENMWYLGGIPSEKDFKKSNKKFTKV